MAHERRLTLLEQKSQLSMPDIELERLKIQQMEALIKTRVTKHFKTQSKENSIAVNRKLEELARLKAEVGAKERVDGFEGKISALEVANHKLSAHIEDLISETEREIYGTGFTNPKFNKQDKQTKELNQSELKLLTAKQNVHPKLNPMKATPRTEKRHQTKHTPSFPNHSVAANTVNSLLGHQNKVGSRRSAPSNVTLGARTKVIAKSPDIGAHSPVHKEITGRVPRSAQQKGPVTAFMKTGFQNCQHDLSSSVINMPSGKKVQNSPRLDLPTSRGRVSLEKSNKVPSRIKCVTPKNDADKRTHRDPKQEMSYQTPKPLTPRAIKVNRMTHQGAIVNNPLVTRIIEKKEQAKINDEKLKTQVTLGSSLHGKMAEGTYQIRPEIKEENNVSSQEGDFQLPSFSFTSQTKKSEDKCQEEDLRRLLLNLTPSSPKTNSDQSFNSSGSISPKNDDSRAWYERLPIPDVEHVDASLDWNNACSSESDSSGNIPEEKKKISPSPSPSQGHDVWTYLGDQTALMPRPV